MPDSFNDKPARSTDVPAQKRAQLPSDIEAEKSVLAACMLSPDVCDQTIVSLAPSNFFRPAHRTIFESIIEMVRDGMNPDVISLADKLSAKGELEQVGGRIYLTDLNANTFALTNWQKHIEIVKRTSIQRELIKAAAQINALAYDAPEDLNEVVEEAEHTLFQVTEKRVSSAFQPVSSLAEEAVRELEQLMQQRNKMIGVPTGFKDVDDLFHGFRPGDLVILAARPGVGKTAFALNLAVNAAKAGTAVAFFSLEMSANQLMQRILCSEALVSMNKVRSGNIQEGDKGALAASSKRLAQAEMYIDDTPGLSIMEARAKARRELRHIVGTERKGLIVIDYLQLMQPPTVRRDGNRAVEVGEISRGLKVLAKEMGMPVIALSQLNRSVEMRGKKRPMLADLRESGSIEQDADIVMFIDRSMNEEEAEEDERPNLNQAELQVAKHRNGPTKDITLSFSPEFTKFGDWVDDSYAGDY